ncbi:hypothetical protein Rhe02_22960 [Rhizocola hellebori]|uniref:DUF2867 domain-containing protein n=1 Tax=Rhizocola hellebori TaxID=1392758 RepID=A0A8J3Q5G2_9ACTN|nr:hypothetical protein [Rhizocola hellebori]GIH04229.1 hypothetical protein Rhe02_22960 [Rhizocola hellebori]
MENDLPFVDEHRLLVPAPAPVVWRHLTAQIPRFASSGSFARLLGAQPQAVWGTPPEQGATLPGFKVAQVVPGHRLVLTGRHRFSRYALILTLTEQPDGTMLLARTQAEFPGFSGGVYRQLVIGSGIHASVVARLLRRISQAAQG